jgi:hypothetical protein
MPMGTLKEKTRTLLFAIVAAQYQAVVEKPIRGQANGELSKPFMYEIYNRFCRVDIEAPDFTKVQSFDLSQKELEKMELPHLNTHSNLFFFEEIDTNKIAAKDQLLLLPVEHSRGNFWFYVTLREYLGERILVEHVVQAGIKLVPGASLYLYGKKKNYRLSCK